MADGHVTDVELLRRELATLILEWAGKAVKDDPDGALSIALTRAVDEAARGAVAEQHQFLAADAADRIAEAFERRQKPTVLSASPSALAILAIAALALLAVTFALGLQIGRSGAASPPPQSATSVDAPIAPLAPAINEPTPAGAEPRAIEPAAPARPRREASASPKPAARPAPRDIGRPAQTNAAPTPSSTQPVGAAPPPAAPSTVPQP